ncbi:MAG: sodium:proton antiporter [Bradyrhizobium sp.]
MKARGLTLATSILVILPQDVHAATLDCAAMKLPFALPFAGLLLSIALGPLLFPKLWRARAGAILVPLFLLLTFLPVAPVLKLH